MAGGRGAATLRPMKEDRGAAIGRRMKEAGMGPTDLAEYAKVSRGLVYRVLGDREGVRDNSYTRLEHALDDFERDTGMDEGAPAAVMSTEEGLVEFEVTGDFGVRVVVKGPVRDAMELEASVARLIKDIRSKGEGATGG